MKLSTIRLRIADLGFANGALTREIIGSEQDRDVFGQSAPFAGGRGSQLAMDLCPPEVGPQMRLQYKDQPVGERVHIAMKPITSDDGEPRIFVLEHTPAGLSLDAARARPDDQWAPEDLFLFCLRNRSREE